MLLGLQDSKAYIYYRVNFSTLQFGKENYFRN